MPLEIQVALPEFLTALLSVPFSDKMCALSAISHPQVLSEIARKWIDERVEAIQQR